MREGTDQEGQPLSMAGERVLQTYSTQCSEASVSRALACRNCGQLFPADPAQVGSSLYKWLLGLTVYLLILNVVTPHSRKVKFSLSPMSGRASLPSPLTQSPTPTVPKGKSTPSPSCQCPSAMSGQRQQARSCQLRWGGGQSENFSSCQISSRGGLLEFGGEGRKESE